MAIKIIEKRIPSSDSKNSLYTKIYLPEGEIKGIFHIVHGMTEHIGRYHKFMKDIAKNGYLCFGYDNLGHGQTAMSDSELGFIAHKNGWRFLCADVACAYRVIRREYGLDLPYYLMGHSMGSFIVRIAAANNVIPDKLIVMGTGGDNPLAKFAPAILKTIRLFCGERHISPLADKLAFGLYNKRFNEDSKYAWLTKDKEIRKKYGADKFCTFKFTISAMLDLVELTSLANTDATFIKTPKSTPILLTSGIDDPVGDYGKGVRQVFNKYVKNGLKAYMHFYDNCRHEILNDDCYNEVLADIVAFIENQKAY